MGKEKSQLHEKSEKTEINPRPKIGKGAKGQKTPKKGVSRKAPDETGVENIDSSVSGSVGLFREAADATERKVKAEHTENDLEIRGSRLRNHRASKPLTERNNHRLNP